ncbi:hypothetical protein DFH09DRAFT_265553 [Mycena vulgaris]|nr:hypothetical protein DFH09DRAFT_265553 [Mycena vulgaris]
MLGLRRKLTKSLPRVNTEKISIDVDSDSDSTLSTASLTTTIHDSESKFGLHAETNWTVQKKDTLVKMTRPSTRAAAKRLLTRLCRVRVKQSAGGSESKETLVDVDSILPHEESSKPSLECIPTTKAFLSEVRLLSSSGNKAIARSLKSMKRVIIRLITRGVRCGKGALSALGSIAVGCARAVWGIVELPARLVFYIIKFAAIGALSMVTFAGLSVTAVCYWAFELVNLILGCLLSTAIAGAIHGVLDWIVIGLSAMTWGLPYLILKAIWKRLLL